MIFRLNFFKLTLIIFLSNLFYLNGQILDDQNFQVAPELPIVSIPQLSTRVGIDHNTLRFNMGIELLEDEAVLVNHILVNPRDENNNIPYFIPVCYEGLTSLEHNFVMTEVNDLNVFDPDLIFTPAQGGILNEIDNPDINGVVANRFVLYDHGMFLYDKLSLNFYYWSVIFQDNHIRRLDKRSYDILTFGFNEPDLQERPIVSATGIKRTKTRTKVNESFTVLRYDNDRNTYTASRIKSFNDGSEEKIDIWTARDGHLPNVRRLEENHESYSGLDVSNMISSDDETNDHKLGSNLVSENNQHFLAIDRINHKLMVFSEENFENIEDSEIESIEPSNSLHFISTSSDYIPYINVDRHGRLLIKDSDTNSIIGTIEMNCLTPTELESKHRFLLDDSGALVLQTSGGYPIWSKRKAEEIKCHFPTVGKPQVENGERLIQFNKPPSINEVTYLLSANGDFITINTGNTIKVIKKSDFNGDFISSPSFQEYNIN